MTLSLLWAVAILLAGGGVALLLRARSACSRLRMANRGLLLTSAIAAERIKAQAEEIERLRAECAASVRELGAGVERGTEVASALGALERRVDTMSRDASRAAEGSARVEERLLGFARRIASPQGRGAFGEDALRNQLEALGFIEGRDFERQVREADGRRRVDYVLALRRLVIAIDSKLAFDPELGSLEEVADQQELVALGRRFVGHARELAGREYWRSLKRSPSFVLMYVPVEGAGEALRAVPDFSPEKFAADRGVYIVTPLQLGTVLGVIAELAHAARRGEEVEGLARDIVDLDRELGRLCDLLARESRQLATVIGTHRSLQSALGPRGGVGRVARRMRGFSRRVEELPAFPELDPPSPREELADTYTERDGEAPDE